MFSFSLNRSLLFIFIFTLIGSALTYKIVATAFSGVYDDDAYEAVIFRTK